MKGLTDAQEFAALIKEAQDITSDRWFNERCPEFAHFNKRVYNLPGSAHSLNLMRTSIGLHLFAAATTHDITRSTNVMVLAAATALIARRFDFPWWYVPPHMVDVAKNVSPPDSWQADELPFPAFYFLLPKGMFTGDEGEDVAFIGVCRTQNTRDEDCLVLTAFSDHGVFWRSVQRIHPDGVVRPEYRDDDHAEGEIPCPWAVQVLLPFAMTLLGIMSARPEYVGGTHREKVIKKSGKEVWAPRILGANYKPRTARASSDEPTYHVRTHWRRGHLRSQHYGPKNAKIRQVFIDPILINP